MDELAASMGYAGLADTPDEMLAPDGKVRPHWRGLAEKLAALGPEEWERRNARAQQYLHDSGVFFRQYGFGGPDERVWPLSPVPVLVDEAEWQGLTPGLIQRAELLEQVMADLYGANRLVAEGHLPPALVAGNPEWLRPMVGIVPRGGHFLHLLAFEIARGRDGNWSVLADRAQAPSGAGYALENRVATTRAFSDLYATQTTHRLAGFFGAFRAALRDLAGGGAEDSIAILTPGPLNETYYEQAWIARYLGFSLVEGEDLVVSNGALNLRTVAGPKPLQVLWRRLDGSYADPVELDPRSQLGTPGLVSALRQGGVTMINALGSGVVETRALMAFLPALCQRLLGEPLALPNIGTAWMGHPQGLAALHGRADPYVLLPACAAGGMPFDPRVHPVITPDMVPAQIAAMIGAAGPSLVAKAVPQMSTTPCLLGNQLLPRPFVLRVFVGRTAEGWQVMPGGFARIGTGAKATAIAMQDGGSTADVWVVSPKTQPLHSLTRTDLPARNHHAAHLLPARAADNLFWLGRHIERAEAGLRLLRALQSRLAEAGAAADALIATAAPLLRLQGLRSEQGLRLGQGVPPEVLEILGDALRTAGRIRDRFSTDAWQALVELERSAQRLSSMVQSGEDAARALSRLLRELAGISGLVHENMYRQLDWHFLTLGRLHERAMAMSAALAILADPALAAGEGHEGALDLLVEFGDSVMTYRRRFDIATRRASVIDLLALDGANPRALRHQVDGLCAHLEKMPDAVQDGRLSPLLREARRLQMALEVETPDTLTTARIWTLRGQTADLSDLLTALCFR